MQLAGLLERSDGRCYVPMQNSSGLPVDYQGWNVFDYPSLGQVQAKLRENDIILVIAATAIFQRTYEVGTKQTSKVNCIDTLTQALVNQLTGAYFQVLDADSENFLNVIEASYNV